MEQFNCILIIDDDQINNFIFSKVIKNSGVAENAHTVTSGEQGLKYLNNLIDTGQKLPEVIFLDINMPGMNGWDFLEEYEQFPQQIRQQIAIYMLSSSVYHGDISKAKTYEDVQEYFSKPLTKDILLKVHSNIFGVEQ